MTFLKHRLKKKKLILSIKLTLTRYDVHVQGLNCEIFGRY